MAKKDEIQTLDEATQAMKDLNKCCSLIARFYIDEAIEIAQIRAKYRTGKHDARRADLEGMKKDLERRIKKFAEADRANWNGKKTVDTSFGSFGFRKGQPKVDLIKKTCKSFDEALLLVKEHLPDYIRTREEIDKESILKDAKDLSAEELQQVGLKIKQGEPFFIKTLSEEKLEEAQKQLKSA